MSEFPHNAEAESSFLGCVMTSEGSVLEEFPVTGDHFLVPAHKIVALACLDLFTSRKPVHTVTVTAYLRENGTLDAVGIGPLTDMSFAIVRLAASYHLTLCEQMALRKAVGIALWASKAWINTESADGFIQDFQRQLSGVDVSADELNEVPRAVVAINDRMDKLDRGESVVGIGTGNVVWDDNFGGLINGAYYALAGRPGTGKSAMMEEMVSAMLANDQPVLVFQRDMSPQKMIERLCCRWIKLPYYCYVKGLMSRHHRDTMRQMASTVLNSPLFLYNPVGLTAEKLCAIMRREKRIHGVQAVFLDHIQALKVGRDLREGLTQASLTIRAAVTELDLPFVTLCHLNREGGGDARPSAGNIKEFDQLYGDVDGMAILWHEKKDPTADPSKGVVVNFLVAKNRDGPEIEERIIFDGAMLSFKGRATKDVETEPEDKPAKPDPRRSGRNQ